MFFFLTQFCKVKMTSLPDHRTHHIYGTFFFIKTLIKKIVFTVPAFFIATFFFKKTVVRLGFSLTDGHSGRIAVGVKQNVGSHSTLCEGHVFCRPHHTEDFKRKNGYNNYRCWFCVSHNFFLSYKMCIYKRND